MKIKIDKNQAQEIVWRFIYEFRDSVVSELKEKIDFIIIYGSAVRGEFVPGKSDVDIIIQIFNESDRKSFEKIATELFGKQLKIIRSSGLKNLFLYPIIKNEML